LAGALVGVGLTNLALYSAARARSLTWLELVAAIGRASYRPEAPVAPPAPLIHDSGPSPPASPFRVGGQLRAPCGVGETCTLAVRIDALGPYHINEQYPFKFEATEAGGVELLGKSRPQLFSKSDGDFEQHSERTGIMAVHFRPQAAGNRAIEGNFRVSVCSEERCVLDKVPVTTEVRVAGAR
jgi:hypothetical protein